MGHEVVNYGMYAADDAAQLTYVQCGILANREKDSRKSRIPKHFLLRSQEPMNPRERFKEC